MHKLPRGTLLTSVSPAKAARQDVSPLAWVVALGRRQIQRREAGLAGALFFTCVFLSFASPYFLEPGNLLSIGRNASEVGILAVGMTVVLIVGQVDLSVGSVFAAGGMTSAIILASSRSPLVAVGAALAAGATTGLVNGVLVGYAKLNSFMVSLGTLNVVLGLILLWSNGGTVVIAGHGLTDQEVAPFVFLGSTLPGGINMELVIFACVAITTAWMLRTTKLGFNMFAIGGNTEAARIAGLRVPLVTVIAFIICGIFAALAGVLSLSFVGSMTPISGADLEFDVFAAAVIGGASLAGGRGSILGTVLGAVFLSVIRNGFILIGVSSLAQSVAIGVIILVAISIDRFITARQNL